MTREITHGLALRSRGRRRQFYTWVVLIAGGGAFLGASLVPEGFEALVRGADLIIWGEVRSVTPGPSHDDDPTTRVAIDVHEQWKGTPLGLVIILQRRGVQAGIAHEIPSMPRFQIGEEVIVFLVRETPGQYRVLNGKPGKYMIRVHPATGARSVEDLAGGHVGLEEFRSRLSALTG